VVQDFFHQRYQFVFLSKIDGHFDVGPFKNNVDAFWGDFSCKHDVRNELGHMDVCIASGTDDEYMHLKVTQTLN